MPAPDNGARECGEAIDEEAGKRQDEDWSVMIGYVQSCLEKLPGANEDWEQN